MSLYYTISIFVKIGINVWYQNYDFFKFVTASGFFFFFFFLTKFLKFKNSNLWSHMVSIGYIIYTIEKES
jgi:hypothetical protein